MSSSSSSPLSDDGESANPSTRSNLLSLVQAMEAADRIRKVIRERKDPTETQEWVPPGTLQGVATFVATGLLLTPLRGSLLRMAGPKGPFQGFVDLVVTPVLAVGAAQVGLVIGTLYGSSYYLECLAINAATTTTAKTTMASGQFGADEVMSVRVGHDDTIRYSPTTASVATERNTTVARLCEEVLSLVPSSSVVSSTQIQPSVQTGIQSEFTFGSWDPRTQTMGNLVLAVDNCRRRKQ